MRVAVLISNDVEWGLALAATWAGDANSVTVVLLDGASALARHGHGDQGWLQAVLDAGHVVVAHDEALRRRGALGRAAEGVKTVTLDEVADLVADGADKVVWV